MPTKYAREGPPVQYGSKTSFWVDYPQAGLIDISRLQQLLPGAESGPEPIRQGQLDIPVNGDKSIRISLQSTALIVIDMQNYFLHPDMRDHPSGLNCVEPLLKVIPFLRDSGVLILWVNWGLTESELERLPPSLLQGFSIGFGNDLGNGYGRLLMRDQLNSALYGPLQEEFVKGRVAGTDHWVHKNRMSALWDSSTDLNKLLKDKGIHTLLFGGVNTDQCVLGSLVDGFSQGYDCVLVQDITATSSPAGALENLVYNTQRSYGFVTDTKRIIESIETARPTSS